MLMKDVAPMLLGLGICVVLPVIAMLLNHQRKMANLFQQQGSDNRDLKISALEAEVSELRSRLNEMVLQNDYRQRPAHSDYEQSNS